MILLDAGHLVAAGTHTELLTKNAAYGALMNAPQRIGGR